LPSRDSTDHGFVGGVFRADVAVHDAILCLLCVYYSDATAYVCVFTLLYNCFAIQACAAALVEKPLSTTSYP
jgi:hypothetical protein